MMLNWGAGEALQGISQIMIQYTYMLQQILHMEHMAEMKFEAERRRAGKDNGQPGY